MSNRTLLELNHDYCPREQDLVDWAVAMRTYMSSGDKKYLPIGVNWINMRHHSEDGPIAKLQKENESLKQSLREIGNVVGGPTMAHGFPIQSDIERRTLIARVAAVSALVVKALA